MKNPGNKDDRRIAKVSDTIGLRALQVVETTKRQQIQHRTLQTLICAAALSPESAEAILLSLISRWM